MHIGTYRDGKDVWGTVQALRKGGLNGSKHSNVLLFLVGDPFKTKGLRALKHKESPFNNPAAIKPMVEPFSTLYHGTKDLVRDGAQTDERRGMYKALLYWYLYHETIDQAEKGHELAKLEMTKQMKTYFIHLVRRLHEIKTSPHLFKLEDDENQLVQGAGTSYEQLNDPRKRNIEEVDDAPTRAYTEAEADEMYGDFLAGSRAARHHASFDRALSRESPSMPPTMLQPQLSAGSADSSDAKIPVSMFKFRESKSPSPSGVKGSTKRPKGFGAPGYEFMGIGTNYGRKLTEDDEPAQNATGATGMTFVLDNMDIGGAKGALGSSDDEDEATLKARLKYQVKEAHKTKEKLKKVQGHKKSGNKRQRNA